MQNLNFRTPLIYYLIIAITLLTSFLSSFDSNFNNYYGLCFALLLILFIGIPHGATDNLVFYSLFINKINLITKLNFYLFYIFSTLAYSLCWYLFPSISLNIFIAISAYHLGQSNLYYIPLPNHRVIQTFIYSCWGFFVISALIIFNTAEVNAISKYLLGKILFFNILDQEKFLQCLIILNFLIISVLFILRYIDKNDLIREYLNLSVLALLFSTTPLMISFGIYFGLWHSLGSTLDQMRLTKKDNSKTNLIYFYLKSIPLSIISITIFMLISLTIANFNIEELLKQLNLKFACFFIFIATITLPHTIIRDKLYNSFQFNEVHQKVKKLHPVADKR